LSNLGRLTRNDALLCRTVVRVLPDKALDHNHVDIAMLVAAKLPHIGWGRYIGQSYDTSPALLLGQIAISGDPRLAIKVMLFLLG
jgi:hypothetical protein